MIWNIISLKTKKILFHLYLIVLCQLKQKKLKKIDNRCSNMIQRMQGYSKAITHKTR